MTNIQYIPSPSSANATWQPVTGEYFEALADKLDLPDEQKALLAMETAGILASCPNPQSPERSVAGLVTGYVQSGKTRSFEALLSMARDNGYRMMVVLAGSTNPLYEQSRGRLERDFEIIHGASDLGWTSISKPSDKNVDLVKSFLAAWHDDTPDWERKTPLLTVLKNPSNIRKVATLFEQLRTQGVLDVPVLVVDDEADQASLDNNASKPEEDATATYESIDMMRTQLPWHAYIQYTATPQAPLLINISNALSPAFVKVLTPGESYVGGSTFFSRHRPEGLVKEIPASDLNLTSADILPKSLREAFQVFVLGVAGQLATGKRPTPSNRSMYIHPSRIKKPHDQYSSWVTLLRDDFASIVRDRSSQEFAGLHSEFAELYDEFESKHKFEPFEKVWDAVPGALSRINVRIVNGEHRDEILWRQSYAWVVIGGQSIDRGFTVEGLTVTYIARPIGDGNADNFQQRARFFGYRDGYMGLVRVYLDADSIKAFEDYVEHEEFMRGELQRVQDSGRPLKEWKRVFILDERLRPTRNNVMESGIIRTRSKGWTSPGLPHVDDSLVVSNNSILEQLKNAAARPGVELDSRHRLLEPIRLDSALDLLVDLEYLSPGDSMRNTAMLVSLKRLLDAEPESELHVILMDGLRARKRSLANTGITAQQGRSPQGADRYRGDSAVRVDESVTLQLHMINVFASDQATLLKTGVIVPAFRLPKAFSVPVAVQAASS